VSLLQHVLHIVFRIFILQITIKMLEGSFVILTHL